MSRVLLSFPGQGRKIALERLEYWSGNIKSFQKVCDGDLIQHFSESLEQPGTIAGCSNLLYQEWREEHRETAEVVAVGHSLGELNALNASVGGEAWKLADVMRIAQHRNELMVQMTQRYLEKNDIRNDVFELWAATNVRAASLREELGPLLRESGVQLANDNSAKQCVLTGLSKDLQRLGDELKSQCRSKYRLTKLNNPSCIPFHNNAVLRPLQEPLYDYIWSNLKDSGKHHLMGERLHHPIVCNIDGKLTERFDSALENFVKGSTNVVNFVDCCNTISKLEITSACHFGPGDSIGKLVERNCKGSIDTCVFVD